MKLIIAEKPSLARTVAKVIGITKDNSKSAGHIECKEGYVVTWVFGHILELCEPQEYDEKYKSWNIDLLPIVPDTWKYRVKADAKEQFNNIKTLLKSAMTIINCGDPDREGQLLIDELLIHLKVKLPVKRLLILDPKDTAIRKSLENMEDNSKYYSWYQAGLLRSQADWLIGMNFTRAFTALGSRSGMEGVTSVGRVQTPTLKLIYDRHLAIQNYKLVHFYNLIAEFTTDVGETFMAKLDLKAAGLPLDSEGRFLSVNELTDISNKINDKLAEISRYEVKAGETAPPSLFKLSDLQAVANAKFGLSADGTLKIAQSLYEKQLITYPRTACAYLPESLHADAAKIMDDLIGVFVFPLNEYTEIKKLIDVKIKSKAFDDKKLDGESHFAIIPTGDMTNASSLDSYEHQIFDLIGMQYIAQFMPNLQFEQTNGTVDCENYKFNFNGKVIKSLGWKELFIAWNKLTSKVQEDDDSENKDNQKLPPLQLKQNIKNTLNNAIQKSTTTKPKPYTEGTLIKAMANIHNLLDDTVKSYYSNQDKAKQVADTYKKVLKDTAGLGTEATRAGIIKTLKARDFINTVGKNLVITDKGIQFMELLTKNNNLLEFSNLTSPLTTAFYEQELDHVLNHKQQASSFYNDIVVNLLHKKLNTIKEMLQILPVTAKKTGTATGEKCPECSSDIIERDGKFGKWKSCSGYPRCKWKPPQAEKPKAEASGKKCDKCGSEMLKRKSKDGNSKFLACSGFPKCKNIQPLEGM